MIIKENNFKKFFLKLSLNEKYSDLVFTELKKYENQESEKTATYKFKISKKIILIEGKEDRILLRTLKWIDDIVDKILREFNLSFGININFKNRFTSNENNNLIIFNFYSNDLKIALEELDDLILDLNISEKQNLISFRFDFDSVFQESKSILMETSDGFFNMKSFEVPSHNKEFVIKWNGDLKKIVNARIHYKCMTSEVFGSIMCDCKDQLESFNELMKKEGGLLLYAYEEGRGFGMLHKLNAYYNTEKEGLDTVDAMIKETGKTEARKFDMAGEIIRKLGIKEVNLYTNNPRKIIPLLDRRIKVNRKKHWTETKSKEAKKYTEDKIKKMEHLE
ncbi:GTP cyclohydrolase II [[Mycoplasma] mobile]|nr:GTP cyclohydrolase II [[Mycoplasma] mobile]